MTEIERGQRIDVTLDAPGLNIIEPFQFIIWRGKPLSCPFLVSIPRGSDLRTYHLRAQIRANSIPIGMLLFSLKVQEDTRLLALLEEHTPGTDYKALSANLDAGIQPRRFAQIQGDRAKRYTRAFLSYASTDRAEVLKRAQILKVLRIEFYHDLLSNEPGVIWEPKIFEEIDRCDLFLLFWSSDARKSKWVVREAEYAVGLRKQSSENLPDITPVILEGPPVPRPPNSLKDIHFNDALRYIISAVEAESIAAKV